MYKIQLSNDKKHKHRRWANFNNFYCFMNRWYFKVPKFLIPIRNTPIRNALTMALTKVLCHAGFIRTKDHMMRREGCYHQTKSLVSYYMLVARFIRIKWNVMAKVLKKNSEYFSWPSLDRNISSLKLENVHETILVCASVNFVFNFCLTW